MFGPMPVNVSECSLETIDRLVECCADLALQLIRDNQMVEAAGYLQEASRLAAVSVGRRTK